jgi:hypothetical protein
MTGQKRRSAVWARDQRGHEAVPGQPDAREKAGLAGTFSQLMNIFTETT